MGNLCSSANNAVADGAKGGVAGPAAAPASGGYKPNNPKSVAPIAHDEIDAALHAAAAELTTGGERPGGFYGAYTTGKIVGHGAFAKVQVCTHRVTGAQQAVKILAKATESPAKQEEGVIKEIAIMRMLQLHPNVVRLVEVFEDDQAYYLVMELCSGGELFDQIIAKGHFTEKDAAERMHSLLDFLSFAHSKHIIHRDMKPENILLSDSTPGALLKVIDFGTSDFCKPGQRLTQKFGTPYYVAPEVLRKDYDKAADVWSAGVIMYILLCGYPPFGGKTDARILQKVQSGLYTFNSKEWEVVTESAKEMISRMLVMDMDARATAAQLLEHRWFGVARSAPAAALGAHMVRRLRAFAGMSRMKRLALVVLARTLTDKDVARLRELFIAMDTNNDGRIDSADLHAALDKVGAAIDQSEMQALFAASDIDHKGDIDYEEFIAAMLDSSRVAKRKEAVRRSFEQLDKDGDGFISAEDVFNCLPRGASMDVARSIVQEVDYDKDGKVNYLEFERMMQS